VSLDGYRDIVCDGLGRKGAGCSAAYARIRAEWSDGHLDAAARARGWAANPGLKLADGRPAPEHLCPACRRLVVWAKAPDASVPPAGEQLSLLGDDSG